MNKKVLITGGTGFIGRCLIENINKIGDQPKIFFITRRNSNLVNIQSDIVLDITQNDIRNSICLNEDVDIVVHLAAETRDENQMWITNYIGTKNLLEWSINHNIKKFIYLSSISVYGAIKKIEEIDEYSNHRPKSIYGNSKEASEKLIINMCESEGIDYTIFQPSNVIGVNPQGNNPLLNFIKSVNDGYFFFVGYGIYWLNYVSVKDVVNALLFSIKDSHYMRNKVFILNTPLSVKDVVEITANICKVRVSNRRISYDLAFTIVKILSAIGKVIKKNIFSDSTRIMELVNFTKYSGEKISLSTPYYYEVGFEKVLQKLISFYKKSNLL